MKNDKLHEYIEDLTPKRSELLMEIEQYAYQHQVPIMELAGIETVLQLLRLAKPKRILEVGTAIGYSALRMSIACPEAKIVTIERDEERYTIAEENFSKAGNEPNIHLIKGDALLVAEEVLANGPYDCIFIDAAKGQYQRFFELYESMLSSNGMIITDNVLFKGLVTEEQIESKRIRSLVNKINQFNHWLMNHSRYDTVIIPVGDGVAVSKQR